MYLDKNNINDAFEKIERAYNTNSLPSWEQLPEIELYMDQVISLLEKYLQNQYDAIGNEKIITPSMINNYVKLGTIPAPVKKRYSKIHLAYLIIVCILKCTLDIATIQKIIPVTLSEEEIKNAYTSFIYNHSKAYIRVTEYLKVSANPILEGESNDLEKMNNLILQASSAANIFKVLVQSITK